MILKIETLYRESEINVYIAYLIIISRKWNSLEPSSLPFNFRDRLNEYEYIYKE